MDCAAARALWPAFVPEHVVGRPDHLRGVRQSTVAGQGNSCVRSRRSCVGPPNGRKEPDLCPTLVLTVRPDGRVRATRYARGCFIWYDPGERLSNPDANAVYVLLVASRSDRGEDADRR